MPTLGFDKVKNSDYTRSKVSKSFDELFFLSFKEADVPSIETVYICNHTHTAIPDDAPVLLTAKPADDGEGVILRLQNLSDANTRVPVTFSARSPHAASRCTALEENQGPLELDDNTLKVELEPLQLQSLRVWFAS